MRRIDHVRPQKVKISILVGPRTRIEEVARQKKIDIRGPPIVDASFSHASAEKAVDLVGVTVVAA